MLASSKNHTLLFVAFDDAMTNTGEQPIAKMTFVP